MNFPKNPHARGTRTGVSSAPRAQSPPESSRPCRARASYRAARAHLSTKWLFFFLRMHQCGEDSCEDLLNAGVIARCVCVESFIGGANVSSEPAGTVNASGTPTFRYLYNWLVKEGREEIPCAFAWTAGNWGILSLLLPEGGLVSSFCSPGDGTGDHGD